MDDQDKSEAYARGFTAGYQRAKAEELAHYRAMVENGRQIYDRVIRGMINVLPFAERDAARLEVLREGHEAGLHVGRPVLDLPGRKGCPVCVEARAAANEVVKSVGGTDWCGVEIAHLPHPWALSGDVLGSAPDRRCGGTNTTPYNKRGEVPAHNGHYGVHDATAEQCSACGSTDPAVRNNPGGFKCDDPGQFHAFGMRAAQNPAYGAPGEWRVTEHVVGCDKRHDLEAGCEVRLTTMASAAGQPAPCKRHAGEGNQLNCADCGRRRKDFYDALGRR